MKSAVRAEMRQRRKAVSAEARAAMSADVCTKIMSRLDELLCGGDPIVAVYLASSEEISLDGFIERALLNGTVLVAPRWNGLSYDLARLTGFAAGHLRLGPMGIREPAAADIVPPGDVRIWLVPGLAFTRDGRRLGYGGGWYDKFLAAAAPDAFTLGVAYPFQMVDDLPCDAHDISLSEVVL